MKQTDQKKRWVMVVAAAGAAAAAGLALCGLLGWLVSAELVTMSLAKPAAVVLANGALFLCCGRAANRAGKDRLLISAAAAAVWLAVWLIGKGALCSAWPMALDWRLGLPVCAAVGGALMAGRRRTYRK